MLCPKRPAGKGLAGSDQRLWKYRARQSDSSKDVHAQARMDINKGETVLSTVSDSWMPLLKSCKLVCLRGSQWGTWIKHIFFSLARFARPKRPLIWGRHRDADLSTKNSSDKSRLWDAFESFGTSDFFRFAGLFGCWQLSRWCNPSILCSQSGLQQPLGDQAWRITEVQSPSKNLLYVYNK